MVLYTHQRHGHLITTGYATTCTILGDVVIEYELEIQG
jgi:hypothetical protein